MEALKELVLRLANADRVGGRVTVVDGSTLILNDCMNWSCVCTEHVLSRFPDVQISVRSSRQSLSGFSVVFHRGASTPREIVWYLLIGVGLACCCYLLLRPPWWSSGIERI